MPSFHICSVLDTIYCHPAVRRYLVIPEQQSRLAAVVFAFGVGLLVSSSRPHLLLVWWVRRELWHVCSKSAQEATF